MTGFAGDRFGRQNTLILTVVLCVISVLGFWLGSVSGGNKVLWIMFVILYGITGGGYNALFPTVSLHLCLDGYLADESRLWQKSSDSKHMLV
jgi:MFS family permease